MSVAPARTVRRLRLRGPGEPELRRARVRLEDALRVATLHDPAGRVVLVRRVRLPPMDPEASPQSMALVLERAMEGALVEAVHGADPAAGRAGVVWFADEVEAHVVAAARVLSGASLDEWFWSLAIPGLGGADAPLAALARSLARLEVAPVALPAWVAAVARRGGPAGLSRLCASLTEADAEVLAAAAGLDRGEVPTAWRGHPSPEATRRWGPRGFDVEGIVEALALRGWEGPGHPRRTAGKAPRWDDGAPTGKADPRAPASRGAGPERRPRPRGRTEERDGLRGAGSTDGAGLLFLLPVLIRLGYVEWSEAHPDWDPWLLAARTLRSVADQLGVAADDPVRLALPRLTEDPGEAPLRWRAPASFRPLRRRGGTILRERGDTRYRWDRSGALLLGLSARGGGDDVSGRGQAVARAEAVAGAWAVAARRWLRLRADLGIHGLVARAGHVMVSSTHVDVALPLASADVRVRRAGLDVDPGWLPWFRRVVRFHYADGPLEGLLEDG